MKKRHTLVHAICGVFQKVITDLIEKPTPPDRIVVSFLQTASLTERSKVFRFVDTMKRLGCVVQTEESDLISIHGNTYAIASLYVGGLLAWKVRLGRTGPQYETSKIIL